MLCPYQGEHGHFAYYFVEPIQVSFQGEHDIYIAVVEDT